MLEVALLGVAMIAGAAAPTGDACERALLKALLEDSRPTDARVIAALNVWLGKNEDSCPVEAPFVYLALVNAYQRCAEDAARSADADKQKRTEENLAAASGMAARGMRKNEGFRRMAAGLADWPPSEGTEGSEFAHQISSRTWVTLADTYRSLHPRRWVLSLGAAASGNVRNEHGRRGTAAAVSVFFGYRWERSRLAIGAVVGPAGAPNVTGVGGAAGVAVRWEPLRNSRLGVLGACGFLDNHWGGGSWAKPRWGCAGGMDVQLVPWRR